MADKAIKRFTQTAKEIDVIFVPQCVGCVHNMGIGTCKKFSDKPEKYRTNNQVCPEMEPYKD